MQMIIVHTLKIALEKYLRVEESNGVKSSEGGALC